jgi:hypothetical protein
MLTYQDIEKVFNKKIFQFIKKYSQEFHYKDNIFNYEPYLIVPRKRDIDFLKKNYEAHDKDICFKITFPKYLYTKIQSKRAPVFLDIKYVNQLLEETLKELKELDQQKSITGR